MGHFISFFAGVSCTITILILTVSKPKESVEDYLNNPEKYEIMSIVQVTPEGDTLKALYKIVNIQQ